MKNIYFCKLFSHDSKNNKQTLQLFNLFNCLIDAYKHNKKIIIVDKFLNDYENVESTSNISDIIDLKKFNKFLKDNYDMEIVDKENIDFQVISITYGNEITNIDVKNEILSQFSLPNNLSVTTDINLNFLKSYDPLPNIPKNVYIKYSINSSIYNEIYEEYNCVLKDPITFNLDESNFKYLPFVFKNITNKNMLENLIENLYFTDIYDIICNNYIEANNILNKKINLIDISNKNDCSKYIEQIEKHFSKEDPIILLPSSDINAVKSIISFLDKNNFKYHFRNFMPILGNEVNIIIDIHLGKKCNNIFLGNFNLNNVNGSNLSYIFMHQIDNNIKKILIDGNTVNLNF